MFVWAALVGLVTQFFLNMEIERYTLATGETALTGFSRFWRHWGLVFAVLTYFANLWPGWATSSATLVTYLFGGNASLDRDRHAARHRADPDPGAGGLRRAGAGADAQGRRGACCCSWSARSSPSAPRRGPTCRRWSPTRGIPAAELGFALLLGALAFAGAGGGQNLVQSNWIRDKGFGMGELRPAAGQPDHRRAGGRAEHRLRLRARPRRTCPAGAAGGGSPTSSSCPRSC